MAYMVRVRGCRVLLIDYLQAIRHRDVGTSTREKVNDSLATLMAAAAQLGATLVLASQLRRASEGGKYQEPGDGDLKESGDIENSAQAIVLLWRETDEESDPRYGCVFGKVAKVKRASAGRRFWMRRDSYGLLIEQGGPAPKKAKGGW
jgi:replicative DNA helicase